MSLPSEDITLQEVPEWLHQSEQYNILLNDQEHNPFHIDPTRLKPDITVNDIDDFIWLFQTCNFWGIDYPNTLYDFVNSGPENRYKSFSYLYRHESNESRLLLDDMNNISFTIDVENESDYFVSKSSDFDGDYPRILFSINWGDNKFNICDSKINIDELFSYILIWERKVEKMRNERFVDIDFYTEYPYYFLYDGSSLRLTQYDDNLYYGSLIYIPDLCINQLDRNVLITSSVKFIAKMKKVLSNLEDKLGIKLDKESTKKFRWEVDQS